MSIDVKITDKILRSRQEVLNASVDPNQMSGYFISASSGPLSAGQKIIWQWGDVGVELEIDVHKVNEELISFSWSASGQFAQVNIHLQEDGENATQIVINEGPYGTDEASIQMTLQQTRGWPDFICCLKAYLYTGINLRNGRMKDNK